MPIAGLLQTGQIVHHGGRQCAIEVPALLIVQRDDVIEPEQAETFGADLLVIVARQGKRELGDQREQGAESIGAEAVGVHARTCGQTKIEVVLPFGQGVRDQGLPPEQV